MNEQSHAHEVEYAEFPLDEGGYGEPEPEFIDPLEERLARIEGHLQAGQEADEEQTVQGFQQIVETWPILQVEEVAAEFVEEVQEIAAELERREGKPGLAAHLLDNPRFARDVWVDHFKEGRELSGDGMFHQLASEARSQRKMFDWD